MLLMLSSPNRFLLSVLISSSSLRHNRLCNSTSHRFPSSSEQVSQTEPQLSEYVKQSVPRIPLTISYSESSVSYLHRKAIMNPNDSPPPSTAPSTSDESTSFYPRSPSSATSISAVSDTSMEFTLHLLRTGDGEDDFQMWAVPVPSSNQAEHNAHAPQLWMEDLVAMIAQSDAFPFENNNPLVAGRSGMFIFLFVR